MKRLRVPNVGHGLSANVRTLSGESLQIDAGGEDTTKVMEEIIYKNCPNSLLLSHYHEDHYNALRKIPNDKCEIGRVFLPRFPKFRRQKEFLDCLFAMNERIFGRGSGYMHADFLAQVNRISTVEPKPEWVSKGDTFALGSSQFEAVWPPGQIDDSSRKTIQNAISAFYEATEEDPQLRELIDIISQGNLTDFYLNQEDADYVRHVDENISQDPTMSDFLDRDLPEIVQMANNKLRDAADMFCIAFHLDNRLLFLGDLVPADIGKVVEELLKKGRAQFITMITSHHGTRWHSNLENTTSKWAISSSGKENVKFVNTNYNSISYFHWVTHFNGDINLSSRTTVVR